MREDINTCPRTRRVRIFWLKTYVDIFPSVLYMKGDFFMNIKENERRIKATVLVAMFSAIAFVSTVLCGYFPKVAGFLSLDVKDAIIVLCSLILGPISGLVIAILVPVLESFTISVTGWYGLVMNMLSSATFVLVTGYIYKVKRTFYGAIVALLAGAFSVTAVMMVANLLITPLYLTYMIGVPTDMRAVMALIPKTLLPFNLIKAILNAAIVLMLYKPLSMTLKKIGVIESSSENVSNNTMSRARGIVVTLISVAIIVAAFVIIFAVLTA